MVTEVDFSDLEHAEAWFETQSVEVRHLMSSQAALRVSANLGQCEPDHFDTMVLTSFRAILTSAGRGTGRPADVDWDTARLAAHSTAHSAVESAQSDAHSGAYLATLSAAESAHSTAHSTANSAAESAQSAARSADSASARSAAYSAALSAAHSAAETLENGGNLQQHPVWLDIAVPHSILENHGDFLEKLGADLKWQFWHDWYLDMWEGRFDNWDLAFEVIKIADNIWDQGAEAVAKEIERIQAEQFATQHPLAETIDLNTETNRFYATPIPVQNAPLIGTLLSRVQDSIEDATLGNNGLNDQSREVRVLNRTLTRYSNDPQRVEMDFTSVAVGLRRQIHDTAELPNSEDNLALLDAVEDGVRGIRAAHPDVAANRLILAQQSLRELSQDQIELLEDAQPVLVALSEDIMSEDFATDIPSLINDALLPLPTGAPALPGADAATRVFNRVSHMRLMHDRFVEGGAKAFDSKTFKTARLGLTVVSMLSALVSLGLFVFGVI